MYSLSVALLYNIMCDALILYVCMRLGQAKNGSTNCIEYKSIKSNQLAIFCTHMNYCEV